MLRIAELAISAIFILATGVTGVFCCAWVHLCDAVSWLASAASYVGVADALVTGVEGFGERPDHRGGSGVACHFTCFPDAGGDSGGGGATGGDGPGGVRESDGVRCTGVTATAWVRYVVPGELEGGAPYP